MNRVSINVVRHAAHSPDGKVLWDLQVITVRWASLPTRKELDDLGVPHDAEYRSGHVTDAGQHWDFTRRLDATGTCDRCKNITLEAGGK